jgi:hypothetical protein
LFVRHLDDLFVSRLVPDDVWHLEGNLIRHQVIDEFLNINGDEDRFSHKVSGFDNFFLNVRHLLSNCVWNSDSGLEWDIYLNLTRDLLGDSVWDLMGYNEWHLNDDFIRNLFDDLVWNLNFDFICDLSLNSVWFLVGYFKWYFDLNIVVLSNEASHSNIVWNLDNCGVWDLNWVLVFFLDVLSLIVGNCIV